MKVYGTISLFQIGHRIGEFGAISAFVNDRYQASAYYPSNVLRYLLDGNGQYLGQDVTEDYLSASAIYFREIGLGYRHQLKFHGSKKLRVGLRLKYLQGIFQSQSNPNASLTMRTSADNYDVSILFDNSEVNTSGTSMANLDSIDYFFQNENTGLGIDLGLEFDLSDKLTFALAANDIGKITWKQDVKNYRLVNDEVNFPKLDLTDLDNVGQILSDTLEQMFQQEEYSEKYITKLSTRSLGSIRYKLIENGALSATVYHELGFRQNLFKYGMGYTHQFGQVLILSSTVSYDQMEGFDVGGGFVLKIGGIQLYTSVDSFGNLFESTNVADVNRVNLRFGVNFLFGKKLKKEKKSLSPFPQEYELDHLHELE